MSAEAISSEVSAQYSEPMHALAKDFFGEDEKLQQALGIVTPASAEELPPAYATLLHHSEHMTVTLEAWHDCPLDVHVVDEVSRPGSYSRHSLLSRQSDDRTIQSGIMQIALERLPQLVQSAIAGGREPLGRILIRSNLLREVELLALWRIEAGATLAAELNVPQGDVVYGRTARILVDGHPAVSLLEIVRP